MITCAKCQTSFATVVRIDGRRHSLSHRKFCLTCSPFKERQTVTLSTATDPETGRLCARPSCTRPVLSARGRFCSRDCKNKYHVKKRRLKLKELALAYKGGSCILCSYSRCPSAMVFHHLDPAKKDFGLGEKGHTIAWAKMKQELDKCVLLCQNCHAEVHAGIASLPKTE